MIKVINRDVVQEKLYRKICEDCGAELEFTAEDTYEGYAGMRHIK